jgi:ubiquinone/menaquinone biosynthesis C-methylase UbiE
VADNGVQAYSMGRFAMADSSPDTVTRRLLTDAGVRDGMQVLDVGCGGGDDVTLMGASLVGRDGHVVGVDRDAAAVDAARSRVGKLACANVSFIVGELDGLDDQYAGFDAITCRRVLMYQPDAVAALLRLQRALSPGGLLVLQEHDSTGMPIAAAPLLRHERVSQWIWRTVAVEGATSTRAFTSATYQPRIGPGGIHRRRDTGRSRPRHAGSIATDRCTRARDARPGRRRSDGAAH